MNSRPEWRAEREVIRGGEGIRARLLVADTVASVFKYVLHIILIDLHSLGVCHRGIAISKASDQQQLLITPVVFRGFVSRRHVQAVS